MLSLHVVGTASEVVAQVEAHVYVCIVVGGRATDCRYGKRSRGAGRGVGVGIFLYAFTTYRRYEKRIGSAGRGTSACVLTCGWADCR